MASANNRVDAFALLAPVVLPVTLGGAGYAAWKVNWKQAVKAFLTGPGRTSRIILLLFVVFNRKNMPFMWTVSLAPSQAQTPLRTDLYRSPSTGSSTASCATTSSARRRSSARARSSSPSSARRTRRSSRSTTTCTSPTRPSSPTSTSRARTSSRTCSARRCAT